MVGLRRKKGGNQCWYFKEKGLLVILPGIAACPLPHSWLNPSYMKSERKRSWPLLPIPRTTFPVWGGGGEVSVAITPRVLNNSRKVSFLDGRMGQSFWLSKEKGAERNSRGGQGHCLKAVPGRSPQAPVHPYLQSITIIHSSVQMCSYETGLWLVLIPITHDGIPAVSENCKNLWTFIQGNGCKSQAAL